MAELIYIVTGSPVTVDDAYIQDYLSTGQFKQSEVEQAEEEPPVEEEPKPKRVRKAPAKRSPRAHAEPPTE